MSYCQEQGKMKQLIYIVKPQTLKTFFKMKNAKLKKRFIILKF